MICSGKTVYVVCILPFRMSCLSVWSIKFVNIVLAILAVCILVEGNVYEKAASVSFVNCIPSDFLICQYGSM